MIPYVVAKGGESSVNRGSGDNPAIALLAVLGNAPLPKVVITARRRHHTHGIE
jgi:hypothetical protein